MPLSLRLPLMLAAGPHAPMRSATRAELRRRGVARQVDRAFASKGLLPPWYMTLRLPLTAGRGGRHVHDAGGVGAERRGGHTGSGAARIACS